MIRLDKVDQIENILSHLLITLANEYSSLSGPMKINLPSLDQEKQRTPNGEIPLLKIAPVPTSMIRIVEFMDNVCRLSFGETPPAIKYRPDGSLMQPAYTDITLESHL